MWLGPGPNGSLFADRAELVAAWTQHSRLVLRLFAHGGRRPLIWWEFSGFRYPGIDRERSFLFEHDQLEPDERAELIGYWRGEFERTRAPDFAICVGPGRWLDGDSARHVHLRLCDCPRGLVEQWRRQDQEAVR